MRKSDTLDEAGNAPTKDGRTSYVSGPPSEVKGGVISHEAVYRNPTGPYLLQKQLFDAQLAAVAAQQAATTEMKKQSNKMYWSPTGVFLTALITLGIAIVQQMNS